MSPIVIRPYDPEFHSPSEVRRILAMAVGYPTEDKLDRLLCETYASDRRTLYVAESYREPMGEPVGEPIGVIGLESQPDATVLICHIAVDPSSRGIGVGRQLIDRAFASTEAPWLVAETDSDAVGFYRACGFEIKSGGCQGSCRVQ